MVFFVRDIVALGHAIDDLFCTRKRNKTKTSKEKISPKHKKGYEMKPLNAKRLRRILADNPSADWFDVREVRLPEKKKPKHQNRFKALYVCARYWAEKLDCEAQTIIVEPSKNETHPKAVMQLRARRTPKPIESVNELTRNLGELLIEINKLAELAEQMSALSEQLTERTNSKPSNNLDELLNVIEQDIRSRRLGTEIRQAWNEQPTKINPVRKDFE